MGVAGLRAKIDTGASTSSLHATEIEPFERGTTTREMSRLMRALPQCSHFALTATDMLRTKTLLRLAQAWQRYS